MRGSACAPWAGRWRTSVVAAARPRQWRADLLASWLRPALMTAAAVAELLVRAEGAAELPSWAGARVYANGTTGARRA